MQELKTRRRGTLTPSPKEFRIQLNRICLVFCWPAMILGFMLFTASNVNAQESKAQIWQGVLDLGSTQLALKVEIKQEAKGHSGTLYSPDQGNAKIPINKVVVTDAKIMLNLDAIHASFEGAIDKSGDVCKGTFTQNGKAIDLELKRAESIPENTLEWVEFWKGTFEPEKGVELEMGLKIFRKADGTFTAKLDSYSQGVTDLPVEFKKVGDTYELNYPAANLKYTGTLNKTKEELSGKIRQGSSEHKLAFSKAEFENAPRFDRRQTPKAPFPYESLEVSYTSQAAQLAGTLTLPRGDGPFPVAITISGSGASDRDSSHFGHKPFLIIADHLARRGVAVLRFDDRGRGKSTGEFAGATSADFAKDVEAGIEFLKKQPKIDVSKIGLIGHSEGGLIAPMIAAQRDDVHFIALLAGTGVDGGVILKSQSTAILKASGASDAKLEANQRAHDAILPLVKGNLNVTNQEITAAGKALLDSIEDQETQQLMEPSVNQLVSFLNSRWVRYFVRHDPVATLEKVECHVLAMNGEKDLQVLCDLNLDPIEMALKKGAPASFKIVRLPNTNHVFQQTNGSGSPDDYQKIEESFSPEALKLIGDWIADVTKGNRK